MDETRDGWVPGSRLTGGTALCPSARRFIFCWDWFNPETGKRPDMTGKNCRLVCNASPTNVISAKCAHHILSLNILLF